MDIRIIRTDGSPNENYAVRFFFGTTQTAGRLSGCLPDVARRYITLRHLSHLEDSHVPSSFILIRLTWQTSSATAVWSTSVFFQGECRVVHPSAGRISVVGFQRRCCLQRSTGRPRPQSSPSLPSAWKVELFLKGQSMWQVAFAKLKTTAVYQEPPKQHPKSKLKNIIIKSTSNKTNQENKNSHIPILANHPPPPKKNPPKHPFFFMSH